MNFTGSFQFCRAGPNFKVTAPADYCHGQFSSSFAVLQSLPGLEGHATVGWEGGGGRKNNYEIFKHILKCVLRMTCSLDWKQPSEGTAENSLGTPSIRIYAAARYLAFHPLQTKKVTTRFIRVHCCYSYNKGSNYLMAL